MAYEPSNLTDAPPPHERLRRTIRCTALGRAIYRRKRRAAADVHLLSYPKCGRTWLRTMLAEALARQTGVDLPLAERVELNWVGRRPGADHLPRLAVKHDDNPQFKTPDELVADKDEYRDSRVIFLVRDVRDLVVSVYFQMTRRRKMYDGAIGDFLCCPRGSVDTIIRYYNIWADQRGVPRDFLLVRYEDLHADAERELRRVMGFLGVQSIDEQAVRDAVAFSRFDNMKAMSEKSEGDAGRLAAADPNDPESRKIRKGRVGGFAEYLSDEQIDWLNRRIADELSPHFGYRP